MNIDVEMAARLILEVRASGLRLTELPAECNPTSLEDAYAVQASVQRQLAGATDGAFVGYKVGAAGEGAMRGFGLEEPFAGTLIDQFVFESPVSIPADGCFIRMIECEFAFKMADDFLAAAAPYDLDAVFAGIDTLVPAIEVVDSRFQANPPGGGLTVIADSGGAGYWIKGTETTAFQELDFEDCSATLLINGEPVAEGHSTNVYGNPLLSLAWLVNHLCAKGGGIAKGDYATVGTFNAPYAANVGDLAVADFGLLGKVEVQF